MMTTNDQNLRQQISESFLMREKRPGGLLHQSEITKDDRATEAVLLERIEQLEENYSSILSKVDQRIVNALVNKQPGRSPDMLQMRLTEIAQEYEPDADKLIIAAIADHYKDLANGFI